MGGLAAKGDKMKILVIGGTGLIGSKLVEHAAVLNFFQTSARNLLAAETVAGVRHHVALSVVGADRLPDSGYLRAKLAQEHVVKTATVPDTILRATQFFEFIGRIADSNTVGDTVRLPPVQVQPEAADDVAAALADVAVSAPVIGTVELAGPERFRSTNSRDASCAPTTTHAG
jgi:uncharacterized protein YbjT (DUF2867 family)